MYRSQHVGKQMKHVINGELKLGVGSVPNRKSVPLNEDMNLEQHEHYSARVSIQPIVQQNSHEQNVKLKHESQAPTMRVSIYSGGQLK